MSTYPVRKSVKKYYKKVLTHFSPCINIIITYKPIKHIGNEKE